MKGVFINRIHRINYTETWNFNAPTLVTSSSHKITAKYGILCPKTLLFNRKTTPRHTFPCSDSQCLPPGDPIILCTKHGSPITGKSEFARFCVNRNLIFGYQLKNPEFSFSNLWKIITDHITSNWPSVQLKFRSEFELHAQKGFYLGTPVFPSPQKLTLSNSNSIWSAQARSNKFLRTPKCSVGKLITVIQNYN